MRSVEATVINIMSVQKRLVYEWMCQAGTLMMHILHVDTRTNGFHTVLPTVSSQVSRLPFDFFSF